MHPTQPSVAAHSDSILIHMDGWQIADDRVRALHDTLAALPGGCAATWAVLLTAERLRAEASAALGQVIGAWVARGGSLELVDPALTATAAPDAPVPLDAALDVDAAPLQVPEPDAAPVAPPVLEVSPVHDVPAVVAQSASLPDAPPLAPATRPAKGPPAGTEDLNALLRVGIGGARDADDKARTQQSAGHLAVLRELLRAPLTAADLPRVAGWVRHLALIEPLPDATLHPAMTALTARLRQLKPTTGHRQVEAILRDLREWVGRRQVGFVHGLAHGHQPEHGTWTQDADAALALLERPAEAARAVAARSPDATLTHLTASASAMTVVDLRAAVAAALEAGVAPDDTRLLKALGARHEDLKGDGRFHRVRKAARAMLVDAAHDRAVPPKDAPPADWPYWHLTRGKTAVIIGGDPRAANRDKIRDAFGFARVEWPEHNARLLTRLAERAVSGSIDVCIFIRFGGHIVDDILLKTVRKDLSRWVRSDRGYGVSEVRASMEQQWAALVAPSPSALDALQVLKPVRLTGATGPEARAK